MRNGQNSSEATVGGRLPPDLVFRLRAGDLVGGPSREDLATLGSCLGSDPRTEALILRCLEFTGPHLFYSHPGGLAELAMRERMAPDVIRFYFRNVAYLETGEDGYSAEHALEALDKLGEMQARRWVSLRAALLRRFNYQGYPSDHFGDDLAARSWQWVAKQSWNDPTLVGMVVAEGKWLSRAAPDVVVALASQTRADLGEFDLGVLEDSVNEAKASVERVADTLERARRIAVKVSDHYHFGPFFAGELSQNDIAILRSVADHPGHHLRHDAASRLSEEACHFEEVKEWLKASFLASNEKTHWNWLLARSKDRELIMMAIDRILEGQGDGGDAGSLSVALEELCGSPPKLPAGEGVELIRRALGKEWLGEHRWSIWRLLVEGYGDEVADFSDLLEEWRQDESSGMAGFILPALLQCGLHREEISSLIEERMDRYFEAAPSARKQLPPWRLLHLAGSSRAFEICLRLAREETDRGARAAMMGVLAMYYSHRPEARNFLLENARSGDSYDRSKAAPLLALRFPRDPEIQDCLRRDKYSWFPMGLADLPHGFDDDGFKKWEENAQLRFQRRLAEVRDGEDRGGRERSVFSLAYWFGDRPETFSFFASLIFSSSEEEAMNGSLAQAPGYREREFLAYCMKIVGFRWAPDERVHELAKRAMDHPWYEIRREAARILSREFANFPDTPERIARHIGQDAITFGEYTALMAGKSEGMQVALDVLSAAVVDDTVAHDGPLFLVAHFGPRKDLKAALEKIAAKTEVGALRKSIGLLLEKFW